MPIQENIIESLAVKHINNVGFTTIGKDFTQENRLAPNPHLVLSKYIPAEEWQSLQPSEAISLGRVRKHVVKMTPDSTTGTSGNEKAFYCDKVNDIQNPGTNGFLYGFLTVPGSSTWTVVLYEDNGTGNAPDYTKEITLGRGNSWAIDAPTGILWLESGTTLNSFRKPFWLVGYTYVGKTLDIYEYQEQSFDNLIVNSSFEHWVGSTTCPNGWDKGNGDFTIESSNSLFGGTCLKIDQAPGQQYWIRQYPSGFQPSPPAENYEKLGKGWEGRDLCFSVYARATSATKTLKLRIEDGVGTTEQSFVITDQWTRYKIIHRIKVGADRIRVYIAPEAIGVNATTNVTLFVDGVMLTAGAALVPWRPRTINDTYDNRLYGNLRVSSDVIIDEEVAIKKIDPETDLDVNGRGRFQSNGIIPGTGSGVEVWYDTLNGTGRILSYDRTANQQKKMIIGNESKNQIHLSADGDRVGILNDNPQATLDVRGVLRLSDNNNQERIRFPKNSLYIENEGNNHELIHFRPSGSSESNLHSVISLYTSDTNLNHSEKIRLHTNGDSYLLGGKLGLGTNLPQSFVDIRGTVTIDTGSDSIIYTGTANVEQNRYLRILNSPNSQSTSGVKAGGLLVADDYAYANPDKNTLIVKDKIGVATNNPLGKLQVNNSTSQYLQYFSSGNLSTYNPEGVGSNVEVRMGAAWGRSGIYTGNSDLNLLSTNDVKIGAGGNKTHLHINTIGSANFYPEGNNYNEGIRLHPSPYDYSSIVIGAINGESGTGAGQWTIYRYPLANFNYKLAIRHNVTDLLNIKTDGKVGIENTDPKSLLDLGAGENGGYAQKLLLLDSGNIRSGLGCVSYETRMFFPSDGRLSFGTIAISDGSTWVERARLTNDGNLLLQKGAMLGDTTLNSYNHTELLSLWNGNISLFNSEKDIVNGTFLGAYRWYADDNSAGENNELSAEIGYYGTGVWDSTIAPAKISLRIKPDADTLPEEAFFVDNTKDGWIGRDFYVARDFRSYRNMYADGSLSVASADLRGGALGCGTITSGVINSTNVKTPRVDSPLICSNTDVQIDIDNDNNETTRKFYVTNNGGAGTVFSVTEAGNGYFAGTLQSVGSISGASLSVGNGAISGGAISGTQLSVTGTVYAAQIGNGNAVQIGDDSMIFDCNQANIMGLKGIQNPANGGIALGSSADTQIYRHAASHLRTNSSFMVDGGFSFDSGASVNEILTSIRASGTAADDKLVTEKAIRSLSDSHTNRTDNPHSVTAAQVGLGNVPNWSSTDFDNRYLNQSSNLSDLTNTDSALGNLGCTTYLKRFNSFPSSGYHGSIGVSGSNNGWAGIHFNDFARTLMVTREVQGFYKTEGTWDWQWYFENGTLVRGTVPLGNVSGRGTLSRGTGLTGNNYDGSNNTTWAIDFGTGNSQVARGDHGHNYDNYGSWKLTCNSDGGYNIGSGASANFQNGDYISLARSNNTIIVGLAYSSLDSRYASAGHTHSGYYPSSGGILNGNLEIRTSSPYINIWNTDHYYGHGGAIKFGDSWNAYIQEYEDDKLLISAGTIKLEGTIIDSAGTSFDDKYASMSHTHSTYALTNHTHSYMPISGGSFTGDIGLPMDKKIFFSNTTDSYIKNGWWYDVLVIHAGREVQIDSPYLSCSVVQSGSQRMRLSGTDIYFEYEQSGSWWSNPVRIMTPFARVYAQDFIENGTFLTNKYWQKSSPIYYGNGTNYGYGSNGYNTLRIDANSSNTFFIAVNNCIPNIGIDNGSLGQEISIICTLAPGNSGGFSISHYGNYKYWNGALVNGAIQGRSMCIVKMVKVSNSTVDGLYPSFGSSQGMWKPTSWSHQDTQNGFYHGAHPVPW